MTLRDEIRAAMPWTKRYQVERIAEFIEARERQAAERVVFCSCVHCHEFDKVQAP